MKRHEVGRSGWLTDGYSLVLWCLMKWRLPLEISAEIIFFFKLDKINENNQGLSIVSLILFWTWCELYLNTMFRFSGTIIRHLIEIVSAIFRCQVSEFTIFFWFRWCMKSETLTIQKLCGKAPCRLNERFFKWLRQRQILTMYGPIKVSPLNLSGVRLYFQLIRFVLCDD